MRKRRRVIPSRWSSARAQAEGRLSIDEHEPLTERLVPNIAGLDSNGCTRTRPLYEAEEAARER